MEEKGEDAAEVKGEVSGADLKLSECLLLPSLVLLCMRCEGVNVCHTHLEKQRFCGSCQALSQQAFVVHHQERKIPYLFSFPTNFFLTSYCMHVR